MPTFLLSKRSLLAATVAGAALLAAGCGSSSDSGSSDATATATWADGLCTAITTWQSSISAIADSLKGGSLTQDSLQSAADDAKAATETFTSDLEGLGKPDTEAGQQAKESVDKLATDIKADVTTIENTVADASSVSGILKAVPTITSTLATAGTQITGTVSTLQGLDAKGEIKSAFTSAPSCDTLMGAG